MNVSIHFIHFLNQMQKILSDNHKSHNTAVWHFSYFRKMYNFLNSVVFLFFHQSEKLKKCSFYSTFLDQTIFILDSCARNSRCQIYSNRLHIKTARDGKIPRFDSCRKPIFSRHFLPKFLPNIINENKLYSFDQISL